jgi:four helix bundle protein
MAEGILRSKSYAFAIRSVHLSKYLRDEKHEFVLSKQVLRSGTSIGANVEEASQAQSKKDFVNKLCIALKEATETNYWLRLLRDTSVLETAIAASLLRDCEEIQKILTASIKTTRKRMQ